MDNAINWFEIPALNLERARKFYEEILKIEFQLIEGKGMRAAFFPADLVNGKVGGALMEGPGFLPSMKGSTVYIDTGKKLSEVLSRVEAAGGQIILPKMSIGQNGFMAHIKDSEGNKTGLHEAL